MKVSAQTHGHRPGGRITKVKARLEGLGSRLITSKELLKALDRIWCMEGKHSTGLSLVSALKAELDRACIEVNKLIREQKGNHKEIACLLKQFEEEKVIWKLREQDRIHNAISSVAGELEVEKKLKRQTERLNRKLSIELADTKASLSKAIKKLESEKRAKEILEQVCDEFAKGIGEDRAQVEELKRQSAKVREEVEKEREMLQLADLLREERVQMKLSEAKLQFEEKNAAVDRLRTELEAYLQTKMGKETDDGSPNQDRIEELEKYLRNPILTGGQNGEDEKDEEVVNGQKDNEEDSADSDLHSIELNMDYISNNYEWSYIDRLAAPNDSNTNLVDKKIKGRKLISVSDKTKRRSISMEQRTSNGIDWEFYSDSREKSDGFDRDRLLELAGEAWKKSDEDEMERESMIKDLRDHIVFGSGIESSQGFASPTRTWSQPFPPI